MASEQPPSGREQTVQFWISKGAPEHVAEGIADRVQAESGFRATAVGDNGTSVGLYQEHADRKTRLQQLANWQDAMVQHEHAYREVTGGDPIASKHWQEILKAPDRATAAKLWDKYFERSAGGPGSGGKGGSGAAGFTGGIPIGGGGGSGTADDLSDLEKKRAAESRAALPSPSSTLTAAPPAQPAPQGSALASAFQQPSLRPVGMPQPVNVAQTYRNALSSILQGRRRPFASIFG